MAQQTTGGQDAAPPSAPAVRITLSSNLDADAPRPRSNFFVPGRLFGTKESTAPNGPPATSHADAIGSPATVPSHKGAQLTDAASSPMGSASGGPSTASSEPSLPAVLRGAPNPYKRATPVRQEATPRPLPVAVGIEVEGGASPLESHGSVHVPPQAPPRTTPAGAATARAEGASGGFVMPDAWDPEPAPRPGSFAAQFAYLKSLPGYEPPPPKERAVPPTAAEQPASEAKDEAAAPGRPFGSNSIVVSNRQRGNPLLRGVRNVPWEYGEIVPDFLLGATTCALYLSLRYHNLHPEYIHQRIRELGRQYRLRILLVQVDVKDCQHILKELMRLCVLTSHTMILSWSLEESARYLETYKAYEKKPADLLQERVETDYLSKMTDCLTSIKSVNKTDVVTLLTAFGSLKHVIEASSDDLLLCPGFGEQKIKRLQETLHEPFFSRKRPRTEPDARNDADHGGDQGGPST